MRIYKKLEVLIGLNIFNFESIEAKEKKKYKEYQKNLKVGANDEEKVEAWYNDVAPNEVKKISRKITGLLKSSTRIITVVTFLISIGAAGLLFQYDGSTPINVLRVLGIFVFLPLLLLLLSFLTPYILRDRDSDMKFLEELFEWIKKKIEIEVSKHTGHDDVTIKAKINEGLLIYSEPVQLFFKKTIQRSAVVYALGVMLWMLFNVTTTDLAFSWSSTLQFEADSIYKVTEAMSTPWAWVMPSSTVDFETVESTRFFRAEQSGVANSSSGHWWTFIFMSIVFYNFIPRLITYSYYNRRFEKSLTLALNDSGYDIINLNRSILTVNSNNDKNFTEYGEPTANVSDTSNNSLKFLALLWYMSDVNKKLVEKKFEGSPIKMFSIGGTNSTNEDITIANAVAKTSISNDYADIYLLVKIWENPNLRLDNMIRQIIKHSPKSRIIIIPIVDKMDGESLKRYMNIWEVRISTLKSDVGIGRIQIRKNQYLNINELVGES